jgi:hypothetical protein
LKTSARSRILLPAERLLTSFHSQGIHLKNKIATEGYTERTIGEACGNHVTNIRNYITPLFLKMLTFDLKITSATRSSILPLKNKIILV